VPIKVFFAKKPNAGVKRFQGTQPPIPVRHLAAASLTPDKTTGRAPFECAQRSPAKINPVFPALRKGSSPAIIFPPRLLDSPQSRQAQPAVRTAPQVHGWFGRVFRFPADAFFSTFNPKGQTAEQMPQLCPL
jgi:hypothetical protein